MIEPDPLQQIDRTYVLWRGRKLSYFSGCDYFRLSCHPKVLSAVVDGLDKFGLSVGASRLTTGNHRLYQKLEERLARFFHTETALLVPTGYAANLVVAQTLAGQFSHVLLDEGAHPSLEDASRMLECPVLRFRHRSAKDAAQAVRRCGPDAKLILFTDGMFSRDGSVAPLKQYLSVLPKDSLLLVDDAHAAAILGAKGRGTVELARIPRRRVIQTITLSKAFGAYGGAILGSQALRKRVLDRSHLFVGSTPLPLPLASAALIALEIVQTEHSLRTRLNRNRLVVRNALKQHRSSLRLENPGPIIALSPKTPNAKAVIRSALLQAGIYPPFITYPGGPKTGYFRFVISSEHSQGQLENLCRVLRRLAPHSLPFDGR